MKQFGKFHKNCISVILTAFIAALVFGSIPVDATEESDNNAQQTQEDFHGYGGGYAVTGQIGDVGYISKLYDASNGLPTSDANYILGGSDGYVYIGGYSGIIRYDGTSFDRLDSSDGLTSGRVIFEDDRNRLWVGTNDNGVVVIDGNTRTRYTDEDGLPSSSIRSFAQDKNGNVFIGSTSGVSYVDSEGKFHLIDDGRINNELVVRLSSDSNGKVYGSTNNGVIFTIDGAKVSSIYSSEDLGIETISTILADPDNSGKVYIGTDSSSLYYGNYGQSVENLKKIDVSPAESIYWVTYACGHVWVTAENCAGYLDENYKFKVLENIPMNNSIDMITDDYQGNLWLASSRQGVLKVVSCNFRDIYEEVGLEHETVNSTCIYHGNLYIGTDQGLNILDKNMSVVQSDIVDYLGNTRIRCIMRDDADNLWISTYTNNNGLICMSSNGEFKTFTTENGMPDNRIRTTALTSDGSVIAGTNEGLAIIKNGAIIKTVLSSEVVTNTVFLTVCEGDKGQILVGTDGDGIYVIDDKEVTKLGKKDGLTSDVILRIKKDEMRNLYWVITSNSIEYIKDGKIWNVDTFPYNNNFDIFSGRDDDMWILSSMGIYCLNGKDMLNNEVKDYRLYTMSNGLPGAPTSNSFNEMDDEGNLYVSERAGVCLFNVNKFYDQKSVIKIGVKHIFYNDMELFPDENGQYTAPSGEGRIQINPAILDYTMTNPLVKVYLEGAKDPGIISEQDKLSTLEYTGLKYGNYKLHIQILDKNTKAVLQDETISIVKTPKMTELLVVRLFIFVLVALGAGFIVWRVMRSTVIRRQYEEIRQAKDEADRANTAKTRFLANISHEIRTPINTIMGMNEMVLREDAAGVPKGYFMSMMNYAFDIRNASESLLGLINDLLDMSKIESGKMHLVEQEYDVQEMIRQIVSMIRVRSTQKGLEFDVVVDEMLPRRLYGDSAKIRQVVLNLLTNAVKYTEAGGFVLDVYYESRADDICSMKISVKDTGIGIKQEDMDKLFMAYERLDEEKNSGIQGTGLGLDISRRFAELMGGSLWCESEYGEGSEFIFKINQKIIDPTPLGAFVENDDSAKGPYIPRFIAPDADILVVDDNPMNLSVIKGLLKATKVFVTTANSGEEALEKVKDTHFNLILLDHMMPGMDGVEALEKIREIDVDVPVYALTANSISGEEFYKSKGFNGYLAKPVDSELLEKTIMSHLPEKMMEKPVAEDIVEELTEIPEDLKWINQVEGISVDDGIANSGGISNYIFSLNLFLDTIDGNYKVIKDAYESDNIRLYTIKVHALKSSARIIGAKELATLAEKLEEAGNKQDMNFINANTGKLLTWYEEYKDKLAGLKQESLDGEDKEMISETELKDAFSALRDVVPQMDYDSVEMILDQLGKYKLPDEEKKKVEEISRLLKDFDWDGIEALIIE